MAFLRFTRDKRGYEHFYLVQPSQQRGKSVARVLYWFRTPPNVKVGRDPFDESVRRELEAQNPGVEFDWRKIAATPIPSADAEKWRERRRAEKAARATRRADVAEPHSDVETEAEPDVQAEAEAEIEGDAEESADGDESAADSGDAPRHQIEAAAAAAASGVDEPSAGDTPDLIARDASNGEVGTERPAESDDARRRRRRRRRRRAGSGPQNAGGGPPAPPGGDV